MERGYVKLWRKIEDSAVINDAELFRLWVWLLIKANRRKRQLLDGSIIQPGSRVVSQHKLAKRFKCNVSTISRRLKKLASLGMIELNTQHQYTVVSICNWRLYQETEKSQRNTDATPTQHQRNTDATPTQQEQEGEKVRRKEGEKFSCDGPQSGPTPQTEPNPEHSEFSFVIAGKGEPEWSLPLRKLEEYRESYPDLDLAAELRAARQWCRDNRANRKTAKGMPAFLANWLRNAQNKPWMRASQAPRNGKPNSKYAPVEVPDDL